MSITPIRRSKSRRSTLLGLLALILLASPAGAEPMRFELADGSVVTGEVVAVEGGQLAIESPALGRVHVQQADVTSMTRTDAEPAPSVTVRSPGPTPALTTAPQRASDGQVMAIQQQMMSDPELMAEMSSLQSSPLMQEILSDPELMQKILSGDIEALSRDPRIQRLAEDPAVRSIHERVNE